jgi:hypothetical protein
LTLGTIDPRKQWLLADFHFLYIAKQNITGKNGRSNIAKMSRLSVLTSACTAHPAAIPDDVKAMLCQTVDNVLGGLYEARVQAEQQLTPFDLLPRQKTLHRLYGILRASRKIRLD